jgi:hypothetical protein
VLTEQPKDQFYSKQEKRWKQTHKKAKKKEGHLYHLENSNKNHPSNQPLCSGKKYVYSHIEYN